VCFNVDGELVAAGHARGKASLIALKTTSLAMSSAAAAVAAEQVVLRALEEAVARIARKAAEGKKLSDKEVSVLMMSTMMRRLEDFRGYMDKRLEDFDKRLDAFDRRLDDLKAYVDRRFEDFKAYVDGRFDAVEKRMEGLEKRMEGLERRLDVVYGEVSSIKTDIVKMMREMLERAYGERRA
jgi:tetrahydromethanopterin S-methyltransferase subunit G